MFTFLQFSSSDAPTFQQSATAFVDGMFGKTTSAKILPNGDVLQVMSILDATSVMMSDSFFPFEILRFRVPMLYWRENFEMVCDCIRFSCNFPKSSIYYIHM